MDNNEHEEETIKIRYTLPDGTPAVEVGFSPEEHRVYKIKATVEYHRAFPARYTLQEAQKEMAEELIKYPTDISDNGRLAGLTMERTDLVLPDEEQAFRWVIDKENKWKKGED